MHDKPLVACLLARKPRCWLGIGPGAYGVYSKPRRGGGEDDDGPVDFASHSSLAREAAAAAFSLSLILLQLDAAKVSRNFWKQLGQC